uniref:alpha-1,6-mannosyl-glycoprotein 6-beta-N-acetylglucosaminyltransferase n=1 Tax=Phallusia mammillata TaxID=59560 RepID=A0A6F9DK32_9ASCI|nr:alpha-1,6-mannosylglycoprotein 6-beta-N-acetylglucosaminyltransferase A-like [Phallusia mammillata]
MGGNRKLLCWSMRSWCSVKSLLRFVSVIVCWLVLKKLLTVQVTNRETREISPPECPPLPYLEGNKDCELKMQWMRKMWKSDQCYADWEVDGSECSFYKYLSEVEQWCPRFNAQSAGLQMKSTIKNEFAEVRDDLTDLYKMFGNQIHFQWIKQRVQRMEVNWIAAGQAFAAKFKTKRKKKKVLLHMGLLADESGWKLGKGAFKGSPLGELVQWADVMTSLFVMGHDIAVSLSTRDLGRIFGKNCPPRETVVDIIYIDILGMRMLRNNFNNKFHLIQCKLRPVDSFGTEPEFNNPAYAARKGLTTEWGMWNLSPKQFNNMFPHTPDNTFLGFVIEQQVDTLEQMDKENIALVYGKDEHYFEGKSEYLGAIYDAGLQIHGTISARSSKHVPKYVVNHGVIPGNQLQALLGKTKVFVGLGDPGEGPAALEAIANGAVFLNPKFADGSPQAIAFNEGYKGKPTRRRPHSQHPYAEVFIGSPHVRMVDMSDVESVKRIVTDIIQSPDVGPYLPHEFTWLGMIERLAHQVEMQDFCRKKNEVWPPLSAMQVIVSSQSETCVDSCQSRGLVCEPAYFSEINSKATFRKLSINCNQFLIPETNDEDSAYPAYRDNLCYLQSNNQIFSCAGRQTNARRLCPCRDYLKGQVALCNECLLP